MVDASFCKSKSFIGGSSAGAVALLIIFTFLYPNITDNADAIVDLRISEGEILKELEHQGKQQDEMNDSIKIVDSKLNKLLIITCQNSVNILCN